MIDKFDEHDGLCCLTFAMTTDIVFFFTAFIVRSLATCRVVNCKPHLAKKITKPL